ncbi:hypothetical protein Bca101_028716 [Brassica carinata]
MSSEVYYRSWMDKPHLDLNTNLLTEEYVQGIGEFMRLVQQQPDAKSGIVRRPMSVGKFRRPKFVGINRGTTFVGIVVFR